MDLNLGSALCSTISGILAPAALLLALAGIIYYVASHHQEVARTSHSDRARRAAERKYLWYRILSFWVAGFAVIFVIPITFLLFLFVARPNTLPVAETPRQPAQITPPPASLPRSANSSTSKTSQSASAPSSPAEANPAPTGSSGDIPPQPAIATSPPADVGFTCLATNDFSRQVCYWLKPYSTYLGSLLKTSGARSLDMKVSSEPQLDSIVVNSATPQRVIVALSWLDKSGAHNDRTLDLPQETDPNGAAHDFVNYLADRAIFNQ